MSACVEMAGEGGRHLISGLTPAVTQWMSILGGDRAKDNCVVIRWEQGVQGVQGCRSELEPVQMYV